jgi:hypothetical protein
MEMLSEETFTKRLIQLIPHGTRRTG